MESMDYIDPVGNEDVLSSMKDSSRHIVHIKGQNNLKKKKKYIKHLVTSKDN